MKTRLISCCNSWVAFAAFAIVLSAGAAGEVSAQVPAGMGAPTIVNPKAEDRARQISNDRMRTMELSADAERENKKHIDSAIANMKEDFTRIQILRNEIAKGLVAHVPLNFATVSAEAAEINKRANRLNVYMLARGSEKDPAMSTPISKDEMIPSLVRLCKLIDSFTENPALKDAGTVDAKAVDKAKEDKARADHDLLMLIKLSDVIHKSSDELQ